MNTQQPRARRLTEDCRHQGAALVGLFRLAHDRLIDFRVATAQADSDVGAVRRVPLHGHLLDDWGSVL